VVLLVLLLEVHGQSQIAQGIAWEFLMRPGWPLTASA
jgi:hypothetical protein